jgi:CRP/FNR family transcriptional regulator
MGLSEAARAALRASPLFSRLSEEDFAALETIAEPSSWPRDALLFQQGDECYGFFVVVDGLVKIYRSGPDGRDTIIHLVGPGEHFAEAALFEERDFPASASCTEACELILLRREPFLRLMGERARFARGLCAGMSQWMRRLVSRVENLTMAEAPRRLARFLLDLKLQRSGGELFLELPARKYLIAGQLGMTAPTFSRCLARLEEEKLIRVDGRRLVVLDPDRLEQRAADTT